MSLMASVHSANEAGGPKGRWHWHAVWSNLRHRWQTRSWQRRVQKEESYLAEAVDLYDLDRRLRKLDREERHARFIGYF